MPSSELAIGIDLGTTNSCVAVYQNNKIEIIPNSDGHRTTPSEVAFTDSERVIGDGARKKAVRKPENTIFDAKRLIGRRFDDPELQSDLKNFPFKVAEKDSNPIVEVVMKNKTKHFTPEEISAMVLGKMKETAEIKLGHEVNNAVITVPAYFNDGQRQATKDAAKIAGLNVIGMINEPTAAALAFGLERKIEKTLKVLIFDLGGGTFDVSIVTITPQSDYRVNATTGDTHFGGSDFDQKLMEYIAKKFKEEHSVDISKNPKSLRKLRTACEITKRSLSNNLEETVTVDSLFDGIDVDYEVTRSKFEELCADLFKKVLGPVERALKDAKFEKTEIDEIVVVGGSTRIPKIQQLLKKFFNGKNLSNSINPDEAVAYGAAAHAAILSGVRFSSIAELRLHNVTPLSLGIQMKGQLMSKVIPRNTPIPIRKTQLFTVSVDNQSSVLFEVYEEERPNFIENHKLGEFQLVDIASLPRGQAKIEVAFTIDENGILTVSAVDQSPGSTGKSNSIIIKKGRLDPEDIKRMIKDAENSKIWCFGSIENSSDAQHLKIEQICDPEPTVKYVTENEKAEKQNVETEETEPKEKPQKIDQVRMRFSNDSELIGQSKEADTVRFSDYSNQRSFCVQNVSREVIMSRYQAIEKLRDPITEKMKAGAKKKLEIEIEHPADHEKGSNHETGKSEPNDSIHQNSNKQVQEREKLNKYLKKIDEIIEKDKSNLSEENFNKLEAVWKRAVKCSQTPKESTNSMSSFSFSSSHADRNVAIGIDLGTTFSRVAVYQNGRIELILNSEKYKKTSCEVAFKDSIVLGGNPAMNQGGFNAKNTIFDVKRLIGRSFEDPEVWRDIKNYPFQVKQGAGGMVIEVESPNGEITSYPPIEILKVILGKMKDTAGRHFRHEVKKAVITVPANFNHRQRQEVEDAAKAVGFEVLQLIDEPTAAAFAFGFDNLLTKDKKVMFFDLGGGTFDISIISITQDCIFKELAKAGDTHFGGSDFDRVLLEHFAREIKEKYGKDISNDPRALRRLRTACVSTKENLSGTIDTHIEVDALIGKDDFNSQITRKKFEELSAHLFEKIQKAIEKALADARLKKSDIDDVVLIGGSTRIPKVRNILFEYFRGKLNYLINTDEAVARGAAVQAAVLSGSKFVDSSKKFEIRNASSSAMNKIESSIESSTNLSKVLPRNDYNIRDVEQYKRTSFSRSSKSIQYFEKQNEISGYNMINGSEYRDVRDLPSYNFQSGWLAKDENQKSIEVCPNVELPAAHKNERNSYIHRPSNTDDEVRGKFEEYLEEIKEILEKDKSNLSEEDFKKLEAVWKEAVGWLEKNPSADYWKLFLKHKEIESDCEPIIEYLEKLKKRANEEKRIEAKYKLRRYLEKLRNRLNKEGSSLSANDYNETRKLLNEELFWLMNNHFAVKETLERKYKEVMEKFEPIIQVMDSSKRKFGANCGRGYLVRKLQKINFTLANSQTKIVLKEPCALDESFVWLEKDKLIPVDALVKKYGDLEQLCHVLSETNNSGKV